MSEKRSAGEQDPAPGRDRRGKPRSPAFTRRRLIRAAAVTLALVALVVVPGYAALQPGFMQRYANMGPEYDAWSTSVHAKVSCRACHVPPQLGAQLAFGTRMLSEFYVTAIFRDREIDALELPTSAACSNCHVDLRSVSPSGDLLIPHQAHVEVLDLDCIACHEYLVHAENPEGTHTPRMAACLTCHDGEQAKNACTDCHTQKAAPDSHETPEWTLVHAEKAATEDCASCHGWVEDWCAECHSRRPTSHGADWRSVHRERVEEHRNCEACHAAGFCVRCHGEVPLLNFDPAITLVQ